MSSSESFRLMHPELMSENELRDILESRCIDTDHLQTLDKRKLIEVYNRIALPLPQRGHDTNNLPMKSSTQTTKKSEITENNTACEVTLSIAKRLPQSSSLERIKLPIKENKSAPKKICLSNRSNVDVDLNIKRKNDEKGNDVNVSQKKRQKITWP